MNWQEDGKNFIMKNVIIFTLHKVLLGC